MTTVKIRKKDGHVVRIEVSGHSGYASEGEDIVCAAVTSAVRFTETLLNDVRKLDIPFQSDPDAVFLTFGLADRIPADEKHSFYTAVMQGFAVYMKQLSVEYPNYIQVLEVPQNA